MNTIDMHIHSLYSDGSDSLDQIAQKYSSNGMTHLVITDHDYIQTQDNIEKIKKYGLTIINGVELSTKYTFNGNTISTHLIGYGLKDNTKTEEFINSQRNIRYFRNKLLLEKMSDFFSQAGTSFDFQYTDEMLYGLGRPAFAYYLIKKGFVRSLNEAFANFLGIHGKLYVPKKSYNLEETVELIRDNWNYLIIAHSIKTLKTYGLEKKADEFFKSLSNLKIDGLEVYYPEHSITEAEYLHEKCKNQNWIETVGSDYHGGNKDIILFGGSFKMVSKDMETALKSVFFIE